MCISRSEQINDLIMHLIVIKLYNWIRVWALTNSGRYDMPSHSEGSTVNQPQLLGT